MKSTSDFYIEFTSSVDAQDSLNLEQLGQILSQDYDLSIETIHQKPIEGRKDGGLTIAVSIIGVSISAIGTIISALSYWKASLPKYTVTLKTAEKTVTIDTNDPKKLPILVAQIENEKLLSETKILIAKK